MDLRGYGGSDKTPNGYDPVTLAAGRGRAWSRRSAPAARCWSATAGAGTSPGPPPPCTRRRSRRSARSRPRTRWRCWARCGPASPRRSRHVLAMQLPWVPERRLADPCSGFLGDHLRTWSGPARRSRTTTPSRRTSAAIGLWPASHCALEYHRWLFRSRLRADGRRFGRLMRPPVSQPVLSRLGRRGPGPARGTPSPARARHVAGGLPSTCCRASGTSRTRRTPAAFTAAADRLARHGV